MNENFIGLLLFNDAPSGLTENLYSTEKKPVILFEKKFTC
jgi:hypothetical protein